MAEIIDLNVVLAPPVEVLLGEPPQRYKLPGDIPLPLYLSVKERERNGLGDEDVVEALHQQVLELFQIHQPELKVLPCGMAQLFQIIPLIYGGDEENPTRPQTKASSPRGSARRSPSRSARKRAPSSS